MRVTYYKRGFSLVEIMVSIAIFAVLSLGVTQVATNIIKMVAHYRESASVSELADQYLEIVHNLPYSKIGTMTGNPPGSLPDLPNAVTATFNNTIYKIYYAVSYVDDPADGTIVLGTDPAPSDYKQVKLYVKNNATGFTKNFVTNIVPKGLEGMMTGGAAVIKVFDAVGQGVPNATVHITNTVVVPHIDITRTTDGSGNWVEVGLRASSNNYHIEVTKDGYSSDQTYPISISNPNPTKTDTTILSGQVTQVSFSIDLLSNLTFHTLSQACGVIPNIGLQVSGSKLIGTPNLLKFSNTFTSNSSGVVPLSNIEWDNYTPELISSAYMVYGSSPVQQVSVLPNTTQGFNLILGPKTNNSLLVIVLDAGTKNPLEGATVTLQSIWTKVTGGSVWTQSDWTGGPGQSDFTDTTMYLTSNTISNDVVPTGIRLAYVGGAYVSSGDVTSSTFDSGAPTTSYTTLTWQPTSQDPATTLKFQIASNNDNTTWNYLGPDGTTNTYYTVPGTTMSSIHNNNRYVRYKAYVTTTDTSKTPVLTSVNVNYISGCSTPGQVIFPGLIAGPGYSITASMPGYQNRTISSLVIGGYNVLQVLLSQ